jgi:signal transduction histidine kinase
MLGLKDVGGKPIGRMIVEAAQNKKGWGWVHYQWNKPHELEPQWKSTYIVRTTAPSGKEYLVGGGIYQSRMEKVFIIEEVNAAATLLEQEGRTAFAVLRDPTSRYYFHDTYVFVISKDGIELVNPAFPGLEGRNIWDMKDVKGNYLVQELIQQALEYEKGWVTYYWPKPDAPQEPVKKLSFVKKVTADGEVMVVGAGMYE